MNPNLLTEEEVAILTRKNQELEVLDFLTPGNKQTIQEAIKKGMTSLGKHFFLGEIDSQLTDYQVSREVSFLSSLTDDWGIFKLQSTTLKGTHWFMIPKMAFEQAMMNEHLSLKSWEESSLITWMEQGMGAMYPPHSFKVESVKWQSYNNQTVSTIESWLGLDEPQLLEVKHYRFLLNSKMEITCYHLSDLTFTHTTYQSLLTHAKPLKEEKKMSEKEQPVLNSTVGVEEIATPVFAEIEKESTTNKRVSERKVKGLPVEVSVVLGKTYMTIEEITNLSVGRVIPLDKYATESLEIYVQGELIALGDPVTIEEKYGAKLTKIGDHE